MERLEDDEIPTWYYASLKADGRYTVDSLLGWKKLFAERSMVKDRLVVIHFCEKEEEEEDVALETFAEGDEMRLCYCDGYSCDDKVGVVDLTGHGAHTHARPITRATGTGGNRMPTQRAWARPI